MKLNVAPLLKQPVGTRIDVQFEESPIDPRGENRELLEADITAIAAEVDATHTDPGAYLEGDAHAVVAQMCVRCLRPIPLPVDAHFAEQYYAKLNVVTGGAMPDAPLDAKVIGSDFKIDLTPLLREEVILATPQAPLCRPDCRGLCPVCGVDLNDSPHAHGAVTDDRWTSLRAMRERLLGGDAADDKGDVSH